MMRATFFVIFHIFANGSVFAFYSFRPITLYIRRAV